METLFLNASFITLNPTQPRADALLADEQGRIKAVGDEFSVRAAVRSAKVYDLEGGTVLPGLIDSHVHAGWTGLAEVAINLFEGIHDLGDLYNAIRARAAITPPGTQLVAMGLEWRFLKEFRYPSLNELDTVLPDHPIAFLHRTGHEMFLNRAAIAAIQTAGELPDDTPGIQRDEFGIPTGLMTDRANTLCGDYFMMKFGRETGWEKVLKAAAERGIRNGLTTLHALDPHEVITAMLPILDDLPMHFIPYAEDTDIARVHAMGLKRVGGCRAWWIDGDFDPRTAALSEPYEDCAHCYGTLYFDDETLQRLVLQAHQLGMQCSMHAIGDAAIEQSLTAYAKALAAHPRPNHRHRIEHFELPAPHHLKWAKELGVVLAVQPPFNFFWGHEAYIPLVGADRTARIDAFKDWDGAGLLMGNGSDSTVTPLDPRIAIHACLNHTMPNQRLDLTTVLRMSTINNAYLAFEEQDKGTLEVGKFADLTVLEADPYEVDPTELKDIPVAGTVVKGKVVYMG